MSMFGTIPAYYGTPPVVVNRNISIIVLDNGIAIENEGALSMYTDLEKAVPYINTAIKTRLDKIKSSVKTTTPGVGNLGSSDVADFINGMSSSLGLPKDLIKEKVLSLFGIEGWQTGGDSEGGYNGSCDCGK